MHGDGFVRLECACRERHGSGGAAVSGPLLTHGRRASRTMRRLGYPSKALPAAWIDELAPGERRVRRGPVPDGPKREAVLRVASGEMTSRQAAAGLGVDSSVVRNRRRQLLGERKGTAVAKDEPERKVGIARSTYHCRLGTKIRRC
ncbi:hypothetical protein [Bifidobacterium longum]|uniref:hypothetical protein n=1 Tax=Bifidobacterium longum TaxID=216816 RepID=UPI001D0D5932|nr:hypothetical protein [Bifidobacterium longum]